MAEKFFDIVYYCDAYPAIGMGHLKRGMDILQAVRAKNPRLLLALNGKHSASAKIFIKRFLSSNISTFHNKSENIKSDILVLDTMFVPGDADFIDQEVCRRLKRRSNKLMLVGGGLNLCVPDAVDIVIDHLPDVKIVGNQRSKKYIGFDYAPVSVDFFNSTKKTRQNEILCIVGGNKEQYGPESLVKSLFRTGLKNFKFNLVVSPHYPARYIGKLKKMSKNLCVYQNLKTLIPLFETAQAVICTYGNSTFESLALHLPTYVLAYKPFQYKLANYLERKSLVINLGYFNSINLMKLGQLKADSKKQTLINSAKKYFNKCGIEKIGDVILHELKNV